LGKFYRTRISLRRLTKALPQVVETLACPHLETAHSGSASYLDTKRILYRPGSGDIAVTYAHQEFLQDSSILNNLRILVGKCMAGGDGGRPTLAKILARCEKAVHYSAEEQYPNGVPETETDEYIANIVQEILYNAPLPNESSEAGRLGG
jgi:hypothetical protein